MKLSTTALTKVLMEKLMGIEMMAASSATSSLVFKHWLASVVFCFELVVRQNFVGFPNVMEFLFRLLLVICEPKIAKA
jgi:hypothetical protein